MKPAPHVTKAFVTADPPSVTPWPPQSFPSVAKRLERNWTRVQFPVHGRCNGTLELDSPGKIVRSCVLVGAIQGVTGWPVKDGRARRCPAGRGLRGLPVGGPDRKAGRPPGPCRCLR